MAARTANRNSNSHADTAQIRNGRNTLTDIGFIGMGNMGAALVRRLLKDHTLHVWDLNPAAVDAVVVEGAVAANGPEGVGASGAGLIVTCLPTSAQVEEVVFGPNGLKNSLSSGVLIADMTTGDPMATKDMSARLAEEGIDLIDAPVSGGVAGAEAGRSRSWSARPPIYSQR